MSTVYRKASIALSIKSIGMASNLAAFYWASRIMDVDDFNRFGLFWAAIGIINIISILGLDIYLFHESSKRTLVLNTLWPILLLCLTTMTVATSIYNCFFASDYVEFILILLCVLGSGLSSIFCEILRGMQKIAAASLFAGMQASALTSILLILLFALVELSGCFSVNYSLSLIFVAFSQIINMLACSLYLSKVIGDKKFSNAQYSTARLTEKVLATLPIFGSRVTGVLITLGPPFLLLECCNELELALFLLSIRLMQGFVMTHTIIYSGACANVPYLYLNNKVEEISEISHKSSLMTVFSTVMMLGLLVLLQDAIDEHVFGGFSSVNVLVLIFGAGVLISAAVGPTDQLLIDTGSASTVFISNLIGIILYVLVFVITRDSYGVTGAAAAWSFSMLVIKAVQCLMVYRKLKFFSLGFGVF